MALVNIMIAYSPGLKSPGPTSGATTLIEPMARQKNCSLRNSVLPKTENDPFINGPSRWLSNLLGFSIPRIKIRGYQIDRADGSALKNILALTKKSRQRQFFLFLKRFSFPGLLSPGILCWATKLIGPMALHSNRKGLNQKRTATCSSFYSSKIILKNYKFQVTQALPSAALTISNSRSSSCTK